MTPYALMMEIAVGMALCYLTAYMVSTASQAEDRIWAVIFGALIAWRIWGC